MRGARTLFLAAWLGAMAFPVAAARPAARAGPAGQRLAARPPVEKPAAELDRNGALALYALPDVLSRPEVREHLTTGLTTSLAIRVTATDALGRRAQGGGRVDVRYELWDEVFLARATGIDGASHPETLPSAERLSAWWRALRLPVVAALSELDRAGPWKIDVEVSVIPFSQAEEREARRWVSESVQKSGARELSQAAEKPSEGLTGVLDLLVATSIQRRSLVRYDWSLSWRPPPRPESRR